MEFLQGGLLMQLPSTLVYMILFYFLCKVIDFITGLLKTWKIKGQYKSSKMRDGIVRWISELLALLFVICLDMILGLNFMIVGFTVALFIYKEAGSILENLTECGVELPNIIAEKLEVFNTKDKDSDVNDINNKSNK